MHAEEYASTKVSVRAQPQLTKRELMPDTHGYWTSRPNCTILHTGGEDNERVGGWRQNPTAPAEHEHFEIPRGSWIGRPECKIDHRPSDKDAETAYGWRYRGEGYDHEHFELFPVEPTEAPVKAPPGAWVPRPDCQLEHDTYESGHRTGMNRVHEHYMLDVSRNGIVAALEEPQRVTCSITLSDGTEVHVQGSARVVSHILHSVADMVSEEAER
jgi:hypothetical protein